MSTSNGCVVLLSGGMDSTVLASLATQNFDRVVALSVNYAQRHKRELEAASKVAKHLNIPHTVLDISNINNLLQGSALTSKEVEVPHGHYAADNMKITVVPGRNTILLSIAYGFCVSLGFTSVSYAAHRGDFYQYPDTRFEYVQAVQKVFELGHFWPVTLWTPFLETDKAGICKIGLEIGSPFELSHTCYEGEEVACAKCGSCVERIESFYLNEAIDPISYKGGWDHALQNIFAVLAK